MAKKSEGRKEQHPSLEHRPHHSSQQGHTPRDNTATPPRYRTGPAPLRPSHKRARRAIEPLQGFGKRDRKFNWNASTATTECGLTKSCGTQGCVKCFGRAARQLACHHHPHQPCPVQLSWRGSRAWVQDDRHSSPGSLSPQIHGHVTGSFLKQSQQPRECHGG